jgi:predicted RNase H-like HicB family nuclease
MQVPHTAELYDEDGQVVARCPELNVSSFGDTTAQALASLQEAVKLFLEECPHMGTLETALEEAGYRRKPLAPQRWFYRHPISSTGWKPRLPKITPVELLDQAQ